MSAGGILPNHAASAARADQSALFDLLAPKSEEVFGYMASQRIAVDWLISRLPGAAAILDIGCGTGTPVTDSMVAAGFQVTGIDSSAEMLAVARTRVPGAVLRLVDLRDLNENLGEFDAAVACSSLMYLRKYELPAALARIRRVLRQSAVFVLTMVLGEGDGLSSPIIFARADTGEQFYFPGMQFAVSLYNEHELASALTTSGFRVSETKVSSHRPPAHSVVESHIAIFARCA